VNKNHESKITSLCLYLLLTCLTFNGLAAALPPGVMRVDGVPAPALKLTNLDGEDYDLANSTDTGYSCISGPAGAAPAAGKCRASSA